MEKMTYVAALDAVLSGSAMTDEVKDKLTALRASLVKRGTYKSDKPTKAQREASEFAQTVLEVVADAGTAVKCGDVAKTLDVSGQKVSAALRKLVESGAVIKTMEKGVALFSVPSNDAQEA